jgi:predicted CXXCH cytochrome family protein
MLIATCSGGRIRESRDSTLAALLAFGIVLALAVIPASLAASVDDNAVSADDAKCLKCHSKQLKKSMEDGANMSLHIGESEFADSVHRRIGCTACHQAIAARKHPKEKVAISDQRSYSLEMNQVCGNCHEENARQYEGSIHARLVAEGSDAAPLCSNCHNPHTTKEMAVYESVTGEVCKTCHEPIFEAYAQSVHGEARANGNVIRDSHIQAPICSDCHHAHDVSAVSPAELVQSTCLSCHDDARLAHQQWLPNAEHHLEVVACAACHAPMAERRIDLQLYDKLTQVPVGSDENHAAIQQKLNAVDQSGDGLDPVELWKLVRRTSQEGQATDVTLRGRMEVSTGADAHRIAAKGMAVRQCDSCHEQGSAAFQNVTVSIARPDGLKQRYNAESDVLTSPVSLDSVGNFYAAGGTRIPILDWLFVLAILAGLAVPIGHITIGKILQRNKK